MKGTGARTCPALRMTKDCEAQVETIYHFKSRIGLANSPQEEVGNFIAEEYRETPHRCVSAGGPGVHLLIAG